MNAPDGYTLGKPSVEKNWGAAKHLLTIFRISWTNVAISFAMVWSKHTLHTYCKYWGISPPCCAVHLLENGEWAYSPVSCSEVPNCHAYGTCFGLIWGGLCNSENHPCAKNLVLRRGWAFTLPWRLKWAYTPVLTVSTVVALLVKCVYCSPSSSLCLQLVNILLNAQYKV